MNLGRVPVDLLPFDESLDRIESFIRNGASQHTAQQRNSHQVLTPHHRPAHQIVTLNSLMFNHTFFDKQLLQAITTASLVLPDSVGIVLGSYLCVFNKPDRPLSRLPARIAGIDLMLKLCKISQEKGYRIYLLGTKPDILPEAALVLRKMFPNLNIVGFYHGYFDKQQETGIFRDIKQKSPDIVFVGLSVPRQEKWIHSNLNKFHCPVVMGVGGSFDVIAGRLHRAPEFLRRFGLEWFYRFLQEPWRIVRIKDLPVSFCRILSCSLL
ncbi:MAG: WecB/TagA/CpsF family glycosyltransferase, partial [Elusimicrobia bacterium]|nr:WecB/TagA/CpsF family glycosyltransferase [Elusimicrobiota bacterium]